MVEQPFILFSRDSTTIPYTCSPFNSFDGVRALAATKDTPGAEFDRPTVRGNCTHVFGGLANHTILHVLHG